MLLNLRRGVLAPQLMICSVLLLSTLTWLVTFLNPTLSLCLLVWNGKEQVICLLSFDMVNVLRVVLQGTILLCRQCAMTLPISSRPFAQLLVEVCLLRKQPLPTVCLIVVVILFEWTTVCRARLGRLLFMTWVQSARMVVRRTALNTGVLILLETLLLVLSWVMERKQKCSG